jgi:mRNA-degrading endonuclease toxin of MazEF toxin-antitoxin module
MSNLRRGDLIFVENPVQEPNGHALCGNHPAIVISNDSSNYCLSTVVICWLTSSMKKTDLPTKVTFLQGQYGLKKDSVMEAEQTTTIDESNVEFLLGHLNDRDMERVDQAVLSALGLTPSGREAA